MSKLVMQDANGATVEFPLEGERTTIGRKPHNDIQLADSAVSGNHAAIFRLGDDYYVEDLDSTNGVQVNRSSVRKSILRDGDEIRIATHVLKYVDEPAGYGSDVAGLTNWFDNLPAEPPVRSSDAATELEGLTRLGVAAAPGRSAAATQGTSSAGRLGAIRILAGAGAGKTLDLTRSVTTLGKPGIQVAAIAKRQEGYFLSLVEGAEAPLVNGEPADPRSCALRDHAIIEIAGIRLEFFLK